MEKERLQYLLGNYSAGLATAAEQRELLDMLTTAGEKSMLYVEEFIEKHPVDEKVDGAVLKELIDEIVSVDKAADQINKPASPARVFPIRRWGWVAASILLLLTIGIYFLTGDKSVVPAVVAEKKAIIKPGREGAMLTLANGSQVLLDTMQNSVVALQGGGKAKVINGVLVYDTAAGMAGVMQYNTTSTPKGRQFVMLLQDGTKVWLNSASSIRYPVVFSGNERRVEITGEVYFEVAKNKNLPFRVNINKKAEVEVLGTHFNVNAYENEDRINTTLLEGAVAVALLNSGAASAHNPVKLTPGQQAQIFGAKQKQGIEVVSNINTEKVMAWKNGAFNFEGLSLEEAMRQLERWYDIEVVYENDIPNIRFFGEVDRNMTLGDLLETLSGTGLKYRIEGSTKLVITK